MDCDAARQIFRLFPQLRESEDEKIMREFNDWLCEEIECRTDDLRDEKDRRTLNMLCYVLTKVKEWLEKQKEQKPIEFKNDELVEIIKGEFEGFRRLLKKKGIDYEPQRSYWEAFARLFDSSAREYVKEQKPAWSEEDEKMFWSVINGLRSGIYDEEKEWLENRLKYLRHQPKQEWSEEDKSILEALIYDIERLPMQGVLTHRPCDSYIKFLKALRPGWKPSEEQIGTLERICSNLHLRASDDAPKLDEIIELLKRK